jgi:hypothetical protein
VALGNELAAMMGIAVALARGCGDTTPGGAVAPAATAVVSVIMAPAATAAVPDAPRE